MNKKTLPLKKMPSSEGILSSLLPRIADNWLMACEIGGCSKTTLENRRGILDRLTWFCLEKNLLLIDSSLCLQFLHYVKNGHQEIGGRWGNPRNTKPGSSGTVATYHRILSAFFNWCVKEGVIEDTPLTNIPHRLIDQTRITRFGIMRSPRRNSL